MIFFFQLAPSFFKKVFPRPPSKENQTNNTSTKLAQSMNIMLSVKADQLYRTAFREAGS
jgi:hypothetical protein